VITELVSSWENISQEYNRVDGTGSSVKTWSNRRSNSVWPWIENWGG
jgi:hypothetical protein